MSQIVATNPNLLLDFAHPDRNYPSYDKYDRQKTNGRINNNTRSSSPNRYYNEIYSRILRISSKSVTPDRVTSHSHFHPINQSPVFRQNTNNLDDVLQALCDY